MSLDKTDWLSGFIAVVATAADGTECSGRSGVSRADERASPCLQAKGGDASNADRPKPSLTIRIVHLWTRTMRVPSPGYRVYIGQDFLFKWDVRSTVQQDPCGVRWLGAFEASPRLRRQDCCDVQG